jgi:hypothetical protein
MTRAASLAFLFLVAVASLRCVLVVPSGEAGRSCRFAGDQTTRCGQCILAHCQDAVNACCDSPSCAAHLDTLDACGGGGSCDGLVVAPAVASCVSTSCSDACGVPDGGLKVVDASPHTYQSDCSAFGSDGCMCNGAGTPNGFRCDTTTVTEAVCCADVNYPLKNNSCTCEVFVCDPSSGGAFCSPSITDTGTHSWSGTGCCSSASLCACNAQYPSCGGTDETPVDTCNAAVARCRVDQRRVDSCSY